MVEKASGRRTLAGRWAYDVEDWLPSGSNARTYGGVDLETGTEIVVKISVDTPGGRGRDRFQREAELHEALDHEAILHLLGHGTDEGRGFIVTRRLWPGSLWNVLQEGKTLPPAEVRRIGIRIGGALAYMHGRDEVHGDISPGNILLDQAGTAYLADFGFSKRLETVPIATSGDAYGTAGFRAPREPGSARTHEDDVYSLAAVLWWCLTGSTPSHWRKARRRELPNRTLRGPLERALRWNEEQTPSAADFAADLERGWSKVAQDWRARASRRRRWPAAGLVAGGFVGLLIALLLGQVFKPKPVEAAEATIGRHGVTLRLTGDWRRKQPPPLQPFRLRSPVAAGSGRTTIVAGRAPASGPALITRRARRTLPLDAREGHPVLVGDRAALSYGPANQFGGSVQVLAMPLERAVLIVRCSGPAASLKRICALAAAEVALEKGAVQPLALDQQSAGQLEAAVRRFSQERQRRRAGLAVARRPGKTLEIAAELAKMNRAFSRRIASLPVNAQDSKAMGAVANSALNVADGYELLAEAPTATAWESARTDVLRQERLLERKIEDLRALRVYPERP